MLVPESAVDEDGKASAAERQVRRAGKGASVAPPAPEDEAEQRPSHREFWSVPLVLTRAIILLRAPSTSSSFSRKETR
jgi:hypothetical protein